MQKQGFVIGRRQFKTRKSANQAVKSNKTSTPLVRKRAKVRKFLNPKTGKEMFVVSVKVNK